MTHEVHVACTRPLGSYMAAQRDQQLTDVEAPLRRTLRCIVFALALVAVPVQAAFAAPLQSATQQSTPGKSTNEAAEPEPTYAGPTPIPPGESCAQERAKALAEPGATMFSCLKPGPKVTAEQLAKLKSARHAHQQATAGAAADRLPPLPVPKWCTLEVKNYQWDRFNVCGEYSTLGEVREIETNALVGTFTFVQTDYWRARADSTITGLQVEIVLIGVTGAGVGTSVSGDGKCLGACSVFSTATDFPSQRLALSQVAYGDFVSTSTVVPGSSAKSTLSNQMRLTFTNPAWVKNITSIGVFENVRCDNALPVDALNPQLAVGCAISGYVPTYQISIAAWPNYAKHIRSAIASGLPSQLTRTTSAAERDANGKKACPGSDTTAGWPRPAGYSCDEYPFRSSLQGAFTQAPGGKLRFFDWCQLPADVSGLGVTGPGWSACMIPAVENSAGGQDLNSFYMKNRVLDADNYAVQVL